MDLVEIRAFCKAIEKPMDEFVAAFDAQVEELERERADG